MRSTDATSDRASNSSASMHISNAIVHLLTEYTGRGPTRARTTIRDDLIVCITQDNLTKGEHSLVAGGREDLVLQARSSYQDTMRHDLVAAVEQHSGRTVKAFMSANHIAPDCAAEIFMLEPLARAPAEAQRREPPDPVSR